MGSILNKKRIGLFYCVLIASLFLRIEQYSPTSSPVINHRPWRIIYSGGKWFIMSNYGSPGGVYNFKELIIDFNRRTVRIESGGDEREENENDLREDTEEEASF